MIYILKEMKIKHWIKNLIIFVPIFFNRSFFNTDKMLSLIFSFLAFSFIASAVYIINDIKDIEKDRLHPIKKNRPIASGKLSIKNAIYAEIILLFIGIILTIYINNPLQIAALLIFYYIMNVMYSVYHLKDLPIIDVVIIACGFIIRLLVGAIASNVVISNWLYLIMFSLSLYLAFNKRKNEIEVTDNLNTRESLKRYSLEFLKNSINTCTSLIIVFYSLWTIDNQISSLPLTIPLFMVIIFYYSYIMDTQKTEDPVVAILENKFLLVLFVIYGAIMIYMLY